MSEFSPLEDQVRECFGRVVYSHKTHEKEADAWTRTLRLYKAGQIAVSAITASGAIAVLFSEQTWVKAVTALFSLISLYISGYMRGFDPGGTAQKHRSAAAGLWDIRESYLSLLTDIRMKTITDAEAIKRRDQLQEQLGVIYKGAPQTGLKAYQKAQHALKRSEDYTLSDVEIDAFVPSSLKKVKHG